MSYQRLLTVVICGLFLAWAALIQPGCSSRQSAIDTPRPTLPSEPVEQKGGTFFYSAEPLVINPKVLNDLLQQMTCQLTVVYLASPYQKHDADTLQMLSQLQNRYYRYGLLVIAIDFHDRNHWDTFRKTLLNAKANFPAGIAETTKRSDLLEIFSLPILPMEHRIFIMEPNAAICKKYTKIPPTAALDRDIRRLLSAGKQEEQKKCTKSR